MSIQQRGAVMRIGNVLVTWWTVVAVLLLSKSSKNENLWVLTIAWYSTIQICLYTKDIDLLEKN